jgi:hypothetical protein
MKGHLFQADETGKILIPFALQSAEEQIIIVGDQLATLTSFSHQTENYQLLTGIALDRESLIPSATCKVLLRPQLFLGGNTQISLRNIINYSCLVTLKTVDISTDRDIPITANDFDDSEIEVEFQVPAYLERVVIKFSVVVRGSLAQEISLSSERIYDVNQNRLSQNISDFNFRSTTKGYELQLLGKNGESQRAKQFNFYVRHRYFTDSHSFCLESDEKGVTRLGSLNNITRIGTDNRSWKVRSSFLSSTPRIIHAYSDEPIYIPLPQKLENLTHICSLVQVIGTVTISSFSKVLKLENDYLLIPAKSLPVGKFELRWKCLRKPQNTVIRIVDRVCSTQIGNWVITDDSLIEMKSWVRNPLRLTSVTSDKSLNIKLENISSTSRVHVVCSQFVPDFFQFHQLHVVESIPSLIEITNALSYYTSGRALGDEYRYIIDRKYIQQYPHMLVDKPTLLSNPWARAEVRSSEGVAAGGNDFAQVGASNSRVVQDSNCSVKSGSRYISSPCIDFLSKSSVVLANLRPDENGVVKVPLELIRANGGGFIQVVAVDQYSVVTRQLTLAKSSDLISTRDLGLAKALDPQSHFVEKSQISIAPAPGSQLAFSGMGDTNYEIYDSVPKLFKFFVSLCSNVDKLREFQILTSWPGVSRKEKELFYSSHASHELNYFLFKKDPEFFQSFVRFHIELKRQKSFLDYYLLNDLEELKSFLQFWKLNTLNFFEQILLVEKLSATQLIRNIEDECTKGADPSIVNLSNFERALKMNLPIESSVETTMVSPKGKRHARQNSSLFIPEEFIPPRRSLRKSTSKISTLRKRTTSISRFDSSDFGLIRECKVPSSQQQNMNANSSPFFQKPAPTTELEEQHYYKHSGDSKNLVRGNLLWYDWCRYLTSNSDKKLPFLSTHIVDVSTSFTELMFALAVIDVPFSTNSHKIDQNEQNEVVSIVSACPFVILHKEILVASPSTSSQGISVVQCVFTSDEP